MCLRCRVQIGCRVRVSGVGFRVGGTKRGSRGACNGAVLMVYNARVE